MEYRQPFSGSYQITQKYGEKDTSAFHTGIDYALPVGTPVLASEDGTVVFAGWDKTGYGNTVIIRHPDGNATLNAHLAAPLKVKVGDKVKKSQVIGFSGSTGNSTGPHLHFEARKNWSDYTSHFDPMLLPLQSSIEPMSWTNGPTPLKEANAFHAGEKVVITAPLGAKAYDQDFLNYTAYPEGTEFYYTGKTAAAKGYTYMQCIPLTRPVWIAVNDGETQILNEE